jgi:hypothetical protein
MPRTLKPARLLGRSLASTVPNVWHPFGYNAEIGIKIREGQKFAPRVITLNLGTSNAEKSP